MAMDMYATDDLVYPYSDGKPMAENVQQATAIRYLIAGLKQRYFPRRDVMVEGDFFWYPVEGRPAIVVAPDVAVIEDIGVSTFNSYRPWRYGGRLTLAVEIWSPSNLAREMRSKLEFYDTHGVQEYWEFNPRNGRLRVWERREGSLVEVLALHTWSSSVCDARPAVEQGQLVVYGADGSRWPTELERLQNARDSETALVQAEAARDQAEAARDQAEAARDQAEAARDQAEARATELSAELARLRNP